MTVASFNNRIFIPISEIVRWEVTDTGIRVATRNGGFVTVDMPEENAVEACQIMMKQFNEWKS